MALFSIFSLNDATQSTATAANTSAISELSADTIGNIAELYRLANVNPEEAIIDVSRAYTLDIETYTDGFAQVETATCAGTVTADPGGNATVTITSSIVTGSPLAVTVALLKDDDAAAIATKTRAALNATAAVTDHFTVSGAGVYVILTAKVVAANDTTLNIEIAAGTATGVTAAASSANTTFGSLNEKVNPSWLFFPKGWNGYKHWLAYTPYDNSIGDYENPCMAVSNNPKTAWTVPAGLINPIEPNPADGYNADPRIFMSPDEKTMYLTWKFSGGSSSITYLRSTTDGVNWTEKEAILTVGITVEELTATIEWDGIGWKMWTVRASDTPNKMYLRTSSDLRTWSEATECTHNGLSLGELFHIDAKKIGNQYHFIVANSLNTALYFGTSDDGINITFCSAPITSDTGYLYKSAMFPMITDRGFAYGLLVGRAGPWRFTYAELYFDKTYQNLKASNEASLNVLMAKNLLEPWIFCDTFNRADDATGLGTSESGHTYTNLEGTGYGILNKKAYIFTNGSWSKTVADLAVADYYAECVVTGTAERYMIFRCLNGSNRWRFGSLNTAFMLVKTIANVQTTIPLNSSETFDSGDRIGVYCKGSTIKLYKNSKLIATVTDSDLATTGTKIGFECYNADVKFDNLVAKTV